MLWRPMHDSRRRSGWKDRYTNIATKPFGGGVSVWYNRQFLSVESGKPYKPFGGGQPMDPFGGCVLVLTVLGLST